MSATTPLRQHPSSRERPALDAPQVAPRPRNSTPQRSTAAAARPRLVVVSTRPSSAARLPFLIVIGAIMVSGLVGVLLLHMLAAQDSFRATTLQQRLATLTDSEQRLSSIVEADSAPAALDQRARALGMVPARIAKFHKLRDGRTVGLQAPIYPPPTPVVTPSAKPTHKHSAAKNHAANNQSAKNATGKHGATKAGTAKRTSTAAAHHSAGHKHSPTNATKPRTTRHHHATHG